ncbi:MAG: hypothetical protein KDI90_02495 [Alphaproteobacteria bacterium]|nr:hypothetical protein [Alphaproteobacteria bacterium]
MFKAYVPILAALVVILSAQLVYADYLTTSNGPIEVSFHYNDQVRTTVVNLGDFQDVFKPEELPERVVLEGYKIDIWVFTALQKLNLPFDGITKAEGTGFYKTVITEIDGYKNGSKCNWVYYVNGFKSPYTISTQLDDDVNTIKFVYECSKK